MSNKNLLILLTGFALGVCASLIYAMSLTGVTSLTEINARLRVIKAEHVEKLAAKLAALKQREEDAQNARIVAEQEQRRIEAEDKAQEEKKWEGEWKKLSREEKRLWYGTALDRNYHAIADCSRDGGYPYIDDHGTNVRISGAWGHEFQIQFKYSIVYANGMSDVKTMYATTFERDAGSLYRGSSIIDIPMKVKCARG